MQEQIGLKLAGLAYQITDKLDQGMFERYREFALIAKRPTLGDVTISAAEKQEWLEEIQQTYSNYSWIGVTDLHGRVLAATGGLLVGADVSKRPWFGNALQNIHIGDVHDAKLLASKLPNPSGEPIRFVDVAFPYSDDTGRTVGVIGAHMSWKWADYVQASVITTAVAKSRVEGFIVAQDGTILLGPLKTVGGKLALQSLSLARQNKNEFLIEEWPDGKTYLVGYSTSRGYQAYPGFGWTVLVRQDISEAFAPAKELQVKVLWIGLGIAFLFSLFGLFNARRITRPLDALAQAARKLRLEQASTLGDVPRSYSEIEELAASMTSLVDKLQTEKSALKELNANLEERVQDRTHRLSGSEARLRTITDSIPALIAYVNSEQRYQFCNRTYQEWFGFGKEKILGSKVSDILGKELYEQVSPHLRSALQGEACTFEVLRRADDGGHYLKVTYLPEIDDEGKVLGVYVLKQDVTESKRHQMALQLDLLTDPLTGLPNRTCYLINLNAAIARSRRSKKCFAVMFLDIDKFKLINDTYGHEAGDKVLIEFGKRLRMSIRETDTAARLSGDEFILLVENLNTPDDAELVAEKILGAVRLPVALDGFSLLMSTSIGVAVSDGDCASAEGLMKQADQAMYAAKRRGRNLISFHLGEKETVPSEKSASPAL